MFYDEFADSYDEIVGWHLRLDNECKQLIALFKRHGIKDVLDVGCGTGMHVIKLSKKGYNIVGVDYSPGMLAQARINAKEFKAKGLKFISGEFTRITRAVKGPFDAIICMGNSLPHLVDDDNIRITLAYFFKLLRPGGMFALQTVHFDHFLDSPESAVAVTDGIRHGRPVTFRRHYEFKGTKLIFHVCVYDANSRELLESFSSPINAIRKELLELFLEKGGFESIQYFSDLGLQPISEESKNLACLAFRPKE